MSHASATFAFDKKSARSFDADGRMRVRGCVISVGEINPYRGREIPRREALGLDANVVYDLYRHPDELERAADSFNGLPLMIRHVAQTADEPRKEYQAGSVYNARYDRTTDRLLADLLVSDKKAIEYVESGELADLSSGYRYIPDMTPGEFDGRKYDGVMRQIEGNHVALVEDGRATGAHVADSALSSPTGASNVDPNETVNSAANPGADVAQALLLLTAKVEAIDERVTALAGGKVPTPQSEADVGASAPVSTAADEAPDDADDKPAEDEAPDEADKPAEDSNHALDANSVKALVDAAVKAERERAAGVEAAKRATRSDLGDTIALDSEADIYRAALKQRGVDLANVTAGTEKALYLAVRNVASPARATYAADAAGDGKPGFDTSRIRNAGR